MSTVLETIRTRGYWHVVIRPGSYKEGRVSFPSLLPLIQKTSVQFRGWDFPHIDSITKLHRDTDSIGQECEFEHFLETWRFYQSGQLIHFAGLWQDWRDRSGLWPVDSNWKPGTLLGVGDTVLRFTEIFELAARLAFTDAGDELMHIEAKLVGLRNRNLWGEDPSKMGFVQRYEATFDEMPFELDISRTELVTSAKELALLRARELFLRFGWESSVNHLRSLLPESIRR